MKVRQQARMTVHGRYLLVFRVGAAVRPLRLACAVALGCAVTGHAALGERMHDVQVAASRAEKASPLASRSARRKRELIRKIQDTLTEIGFYTGPVDGRMNLEIILAISLYQERSNLAVDGVASKELLERLRFSDKVKRLQSRLAETRATQISEARAALASTAATRRLVEQATPEVANPTRDASGCFLAPTVACLLDEAIESAKAIFRTQFRDWALGEVLVSQARAGLSVDALATLRRIDDPRLVVVGLKNMSQAQAAAGAIEQARATALTIPLSWSQAEALAAVAVAHARSGDADAAWTATRQVLALADEPAQLRRRVAALHKLTVELAQVGEERGSNAALERAIALVAGAQGHPDRDALLSEVAVALAELGRIAEAFAMLGEIGDSKHHRPIFFAAAQAYARAGEAERAVATAGEVEESRYRAIVLSQIPVAQHRAGAPGQALETLAKALAASREIDQRARYPRDYAVAQIALAFVAIEAVEKALETAAEIGDARLRTDVLWTIGAAQARTRRRPVRAPHLRPRQRRPGHHQEPARPRLGTRQPGENPLSGRPRPGRQTRLSPSPRHRSGDHLAVGPHASAGQGRGDPAHARRRGHVSRPLVKLPFRRPESAQLSHPCRRCRAASPRPRRRRSPVIRPTI